MPSLNAVARIGSYRDRQGVRVSDRRKMTFFREAEVYFLKQKRNVSRALTGIYLSSDAQRDAAPRQCRRR